MSFQPPIPQALWDQVPPAAQAALATVLQHYQQRLAALEGRLRELQERLGQNSTNSSKPPSSDGPAVKRSPPRPRGERPKGGQSGHPRHSRPLLPPEHVEHLRPTACRRCGHALRGDDPAPLVHQVLELPPIRPVVTEYRRHRLCCPHCHTSTCAALPADVAGTTCGPRLQAAVALLTGACRLSKRTASWICHGLLGVPLSPAEVCGLERQATEALTPAVAEARAHVQAQPANVDETSWPEGRRKGWLWAAVTSAVTVFLVRRARDAAALRAVLGAGHDRVVTSDRFSTYGVLPLERRQVCWAHLRRDFQAMIDRGGAARAVGLDLLAVSDDLFFFWPKVRDGTWRREQFQRQVPAWRAELRAALERGAGCGCAKAAATCRELLALEPALWTFADVAGVEPTNNAAERALRHAVQWRKTSYGTDSPGGSRFVEAILTVVASCRQQGRNVLEFVRACCEALRHKSTPPALVPSD
jgi:transposase